MKYQLSLSFIWKNWGHDCQAKELSEANFFYVTKNIFKNKYRLKKIFLKMSNNVGNDIIQHLLRLWFFYDSWTKWKKNRYGWINNWIIFNMRDHLAPLSFEKTDVMVVTIRGEWGGEFFYITQCISKNINTRVSRFLLKMADNIEH